MPYDFCTGKWYDDDETDEDAEESERADDVLSRIEVNETVAR